MLLSEVNKIRNQTHKYKKKNKYLIRCFGAWGHGHVSLSETRAPLDGIAAAQDKNNPLDFLNVPT